MEHKKQMILKKGYQPIGYLFYQGQKIGRCGVTIDNTINSKNGVVLNYRFTYKTFAYYVDLSIDWFMMCVEHDVDIYIGLLQSRHYFEVAPWFCKKMNAKYELQRKGVELLFIDSRGGTDK